MKTSIEKRKDFGMGKVGLLRTTESSTASTKALPDHQTIEESFRRAELKKAEAITLLRSHPHIY